MTLTHPAKREHRRKQANPWGRLFFGDFLLAKQKKVTATRGMSALVVKSKLHFTIPLSLSHEGTSPTPASTPYGSPASVEPGCSHPGFRKSHREAIQRRFDRVPMDSPRGAERFAVVDASSAHTLRSDSEAFV